MANIAFDIIDDSFHFDFLLAAVTAFLWLRCILLLRLTELFGPLIVIIWNMTIIILQFFVIYILVILTFASIATLTLSELPVFRNLFEAIRIYLMASLGNFDLFQYDILDGWKRYYGVGMHLLVLFSNMILLINLLIAIMGDTYGNLVSVKTGLFWSSVIQEMPKYVYNKHYGILTMIPFTFSFMSLILLPVLVLSDNLDTLTSINNAVFMIVYFPVSIFMLMLFMAVNLILLPFAYVKTVVHKVVILQRYRGRH